MKADFELILASASPRRRELLETFDLPFSIAPADIDESLPERESPPVYVVRMAREKAELVAGQRPGSWVLGADTAVVLEGRVLGKPADQTEAAAMLKSLSGRSHQVMSAVALCGPDRQFLQRLSITEVSFAELPDAWIESYVRTGDPMDKAGAYGIQNQAGIWIQTLKGSYHGVVGLPLFETGELLREAGLLK